MARWRQSYRVKGTFLQAEAAACAKALRWEWACQRIESRLVWLKDKEREGE